MEWGRGMDGEGVWRCVAGCGGGSVLKGAEMLEGCGGGAVEGLERGGGVEGCSVLVWGGGGRGVEGWRGWSGWRLEWMEVMVGVEE